MNVKQPSLEVQLRQSEPFHLNVSLQCCRGELLALTGPSGSGKTTVLRAIAGLHRSTTGIVSCNNLSWQNTDENKFAAPQHRRAGLVFQHYALFPHLSVLDNVITAMSHVSRAERKVKAMQWLQLTNMEGLHQQRPHRLSGGQRQRVALARALAREPDVLLLDEPFSAVDQLTRQKLYRELALIRSSLEVPMILVTHDMLEVQQLADSICLMHHGTTLQSGPVSQVIRNPQNARIARLLGHKNIYTGTYTSNASTGKLRALGIEFNLDRISGIVDGPVSVLIEPSAIIMHRTDRPSNGERENPITTRVGEAIEMGDDLVLKLIVEATGESVAFRISRHVAARNDVTTDSQLGVSILAEGIHLMPPEDTQLSITSI
ncbi:MAG: ABC transporter ATP-binding protein [Gammaproteobacteria bacterium]|nr:ABC transporter ATP-binding protein [Gammaproteobacteria bacterium]